MLHWSPIQSPVTDQVQEGLKHCRREDQNCYQAVPAQFLVHHGKWVEEDDLNVEDNEDHGDEVEADRETLWWFFHIYDSALICHHLRGRGPRWHQDL